MINFLSIFNNKSKYYSTNYNHAFELQKCGFPIISIKDDAYYFLKTKELIAHLGKEDLFGKKY